MSQTAAQDRRKREATALRQKIVDAALQVFADEGYERVSMRKIAARIAYSPTTIYRFFDNKEELLWAIGADTYRELSIAFERVKAAGSPPLATLRALIREYIDFCVARPEMVKLLSDIASFEVDDGVLYERFGKNRQRVYQSWFACIRAAIEQGQLGLEDDWTVFSFLWDSVSGHIDHRIRHAGLARGSAVHATSDFVELLFRGLEA